MLLRFIRPVSIVIVPRFDIEITTGMLPAFELKEKTGIS
jgi:hypothetical protein